MWNISRRPLLSALRNLLQYALARSRALPVRAPSTLSRTNGGPAKPAANTTNIRACSSTTQQLLTCAEATSSATTRKARAPRFPFPPQRGILPQTKQLLTNNRNPPSATKLTRPTIWTTLSRRIMLFDPLARAEMPTNAHHTHPGSAECRAQHIPNRAEDPSVRPPSTWTTLSKHRGEERRRGHKHRPGRFRGAGASRRLHLEWPATLAAKPTTRGTSMPRVNRRRSLPRRYFQPVASPRGPSPPSRS